MAVAKRISAWCMLSSALAVTCFPGSDTSPSQMVPLTSTRGITGLPSAELTLAASLRIRGAGGAVWRTAECEGTMSSTLTRLTGGDPGVSPLTLVLDCDRADPTCIKADPALPLAAALKEYRELRKREGVAVQFHFSNGQRLGEMIELDRTPHELCIMDAETLRVIEIPDKGGCVPPSWRGLPVEHGSQYAHTLNYWMETLGLRGGCVEGQDRTDSELDRSSAVMDDCEKENMGSTPDPSLADGGGASRTLLEAGAFGVLIETVIAGIARDPKAGDAAFMVLQCAHPDPLESKVLYCSPRVPDVIGQGKSDFVGRPWREVYGHVTSERLGHWRKLTDGLETVGSRFALPWAQAGEEHLVYAEPLLYLEEDDTVELLCVAINNVSNLPLGRPGERHDDCSGKFLSEEYGEEEPPSLRTVHSALDYQRRVAFNVKTFFSDAIIRTFPLYEAYGTFVNRTRLLDRAYEKVKGPPPNTSFDDDSDDLFTENVTAICEVLGDWYAEHHNWTVSSVRSVVQLLSCYVGVSQVIGLTPSHHVRWQILEDRRLAKLTAKEAAPGPSFEPGVPAREKLDLARQMLEEMRGEDSNFLGFGSVHAAALRAGGTVQEDEIELSSFAAAYTETGHAQADDGEEEEAVGVEDEAENVSAKFDVGANHENVCDEDGDQDLANIVTTGPESAAVEAMRGGFGLSSRDTALRCAQEGTEGLEQVTPDGRRGSYPKLRDEITKLYISEFPAYDQDTDAELLAVRSDEAIARAAEAFMANLEADGTTRAEAERRTRAFLGGREMRMAAAQYVFKLEMERLRDKERVLDSRWKSVVAFANLFLFTPLAWYFLTSVPTREIKEVLEYSSHILNDFLSNLGL